MKNKNVKDEKKEKKIGLTTKDFHCSAFRCCFWNCTLLSDSRQQGKK